MVSTVTIDDFFLGPQVIDLSAGGVLVLDVDGTVADISHRRKHVEARPKDWKMFHANMHLDMPVATVVRVAQMITSSPGWRTVVCTGRHRGHEELTVTWLEQHSISFEEIYMRDEGDRRQDDVVKRELLGFMRKDGCYPTLVFEDRDRVVRMWRSHGIPCVQVAEGNF